MLPKGAGEALRTLKSTRLGVRAGPAAVLLIAWGAASAPLPAAEPALDPAAAEERGFDVLESEKPDYAAARHWFEQAAAAGRPMARHELATLYWNGMGGAEDRERAIELHRAAARQGVAQAQTVLGWAHLTGTVAEQDFPLARKWLSAAAHQGAPPAMYLLALMHRDGQGARPDPEFADQLTERAAELGYLPAIYSLAASWLDPSSARHDPEKGLFILTRAAATDALAAVQLGHEYLRGTHAGPDPQAAYEWISRGAGMGDAQARLWQAEFLSRGIGVERNDALASETRAAALDAATPTEVNDFCWALAVSDDSGLRNGARAVALMEDLLSNPENRTVAYLDTLAAAYAENGDFDKAVETQLAAIALANETSFISDPDFGERLALYRRGEPYRAPR